MPGCARAFSASAIFAVLVGFGACAKSEPQRPENTQAAGSPATSGASAGAASGSNDTRGAPAKPAADGGRAGAPALTDSSASVMNLPPTGGAANAGPGKLLVDVSTQGSGVCAGVTAVAVIAAMQGAHPELADIPSTRDPRVAGDGSFVFSYLRDDGSFALIVKRGSGDCVAGCISKEYWYFDTDAMCKPRQVGHYDDAFNDAENCYTIEGEPLWDVPAKADPAYICKAGSTASNTDDGGTPQDAGGVDICEARWVDFSKQLQQVVLSHASCTSDDDCVGVSNSSECHPSCGTVVNRKGVDAIANAIASAGAASCRADGILCPTTPAPPCIEYRAVCVDEMCSGVP